MLFLIRSDNYKPVNLSNIHIYIYKFCAPISRAQFARFSLDFLDDKLTTLGFDPSKISSSITSLLCYF